MKFKYIILIIILLSIAKYTSLEPKLNLRLVRTTNREDLQKVYRCCSGRCFLVESYTEQYNVVREVSNEEVYRSEDPLIFRSGFCSKELIFKNN